MSSDESPKAKCSVRLFAQLNVTLVPKELVEELEREFDTSSSEGEKVGIV